MFEWILYSVIFMLVLVVSYSLFQWTAAHTWAKKENRLKEPDDEPEMVLGEWTSVLAAQSPMTLAKRQELEKELREAGFYQSSAVMEYAAVRALLILIPLAITAALVCVMDEAYAGRIVMYGCCGALLGFSVPRMYVNYRAKQRASEIERGLPVAIDLIGLGLTGGQNIFASLSRVCRELTNSYPTLAQELFIVHHQAELSSLDQALQHFANRTNLQEVRTLSLVLAQSERLGTDISQALLEFSTNFRTNLRQRAEAYANRASFWMLFPTVLCLWIPAVIILFGPVYHEFWRKRQETQQIYKELRMDKVGDDVEILRGGRKTDAKKLKQ